MNLEDTLTQTLQAHLDAVDLPSGDVVGARRTGGRMRVRRRVTAGAVALAFVAAGSTGSLIAHDRRADGPSGQIGQWRQLPTPPLSPRVSALAAWTGHEVVVAGGDVHPCPPTADCNFAADGLRDGAAYDPATDSWHAVADAPAPVSSEDEVVVADGKVVVRTGGPDWFVYDPVADRWQSVPAEALHGQGYWLSARGTRVYTVTHHGIAFLDVRTLEWTRLPLDPIRPALTTRTVTATDVGPVVAGYDATKPNDGRQPSLVLADAWNGTSWRRLPPSDQLEPAFSWTGHRMVDPTPFNENGGEVDGWGRDIPQGGTLDPVTGSWGRLPTALTGDPDGWGVSAQGGPWFAVAGQVYNDETGQVSTLPRPEGAPDFDVSGAWADGRLVVFGGVDSSQGFGPDALTNHAWIYTP